SPPPHLPLPALPPRTDLAVRPTAAPLVLAGAPASAVVCTVGAATAPATAPPAARAVLAQAVAVVAVVAVVFLLDPPLPLRTLPPVPSTSFPRGPVFLRCTRVSCPTARLSSWTRLRTTPRCA